MSELIDKNVHSVEDDEWTLRPKTLEEYIGQDNLKNNLKIFIGAALKRNETLDHVLLYGPPGLGKTSLANIIANEMKVNFKFVNGPAIEKTGDLAALLANLSPGDVLFIDEIHRLPLFIEESLYSAMEDFKFSVVINRDTNPRDITLDLPPFTLVGATTKAGSLSAPLRARFGICEKLDFYTVNDLQKIVVRTSKVYKIPIDELAAYEIAKRSRGTPRIANKIYRRVRDFANYKSLDFISQKECLNALKQLKIDELGLDEVDRSYITALISRFNGGPVGLETLANSIGEEAINLEDVYEPYLLQLGFIDRTPKGRIAKEKAYTHYKLAHKKEKS